MAVCDRNRHQHHPLPPLCPSQRERNRERVRLRVGVRLREHHGDGGEIPGFQCDSENSMEMELERDSERGKEALER